MENLREMLLVIKNRFSKRDFTEQIPALRKRKSLFYKYYEALQEPDFVKEADISEHLFDAAPSDSRYKTLKYRFTRTLESFFFTADLPKKMLNESVYYKLLCYRDLALIKTLLLLNARNTAAGLAEKTINIARKYELTDIILLLARDLSFHYMYNSSLHLYHKYSKMLEDTMGLVQAEYKAEKYYNDIAIHFSGSTAYKPELLPQMKTNLDALKVILKTHNTFNINLSNFRLLVLYYPLLFDFEANLSVLDKWEEFLKTSGQAASSVNFQETGILRLNALLHLKAYDKFRTVAEGLLPALRPGGSNWFTFHDLFFLILMHTGKHTKAASLVKEVIKTETFKYQPEPVKELWRIYEAYCWFVLQSKQKQQHQPGGYSSFNIDLFMENIPVYSKDKTGENLSVLFIQLLVNLNKAELYSEIEKRFDAIRRYANRHLKDDFYRAAIFIKMLLLLNKHDFNYTLVKKGGEKYLKKLSGPGSGFNSNSFIVEILPFEILWDYALHSLQTNELETIYKIHKQKQAVSGNGIVADLIMEEN